MIKNPKYKIGDKVAIQGAINILCGTVYRKTQFFVTIKFTHRLSKNRKYWAKLPYHDYRPISKEWIDKRILKIRRKK